MTNRPGRVDPRKPFRKTGPTRINNDNRRKTVVRNNNRRNHTVVRNNNRVRNSVRQTTVVNRPVRQTVVRRPVRGNRGVVRQPVRQSVVRRPVVRNRRVVVNRPHYRPAYQPVQHYTYAPNVYPPAYSVVNNYNPYLYSNYYDRRAYRRRCRNRVNWPLLMLGFFISRPYSNYDYARVGYDQPYFYGEDGQYQAGPVGVGGPESAPLATSTPQLDSKEAVMLASLSEFVDANSVDGGYQLADPAFGGEVWNLDLAQAPAVFEVESGLYSVVAGFEGTLGQSQVPSNVTVEFFLVQNGDTYEVRDAWIASANGIAREKLYQSPAYPQVQTWQADAVCPFTGQTMVPVTAQTSEHG